MIASKPERAKPSLCQPIKSMFGIRRMMMSGRMGGLDRNGFGLGAAEPGDDEKPRHQDRREERGDDADAQGHGEAFDRAGAEPEHEEAGDERRHVAVENGAEGALEARLQRG